jgi:formylglycine-generating enzyme required for sulfatase activity
MNDIIKKPGKDPSPIKPAEASGSQPNDVPLEVGKSIIKKTGDILTSILAPVLLCAIFIILAGGSSPYLHLESWVQWIFKVSSPFVLIGGILLLIGFRRQKKFRWYIYIISTIATLGAAYGLVIWNPGPTTSNYIEAQSTLEVVVKTAISDGISPLLTPINGALQTQQAIFATLSFINTSPTEEPKNLTTPPTEIPINPTIPPNMVEIPSGVFIVGDKFTDSFAYPEQTITLDTFWVDIYEVSNSEYRACVEAPENSFHCSVPGPAASAMNSSYFSDTRFDDYPVIGVSYQQAKEYCEDYFGELYPGSILPNEFQWEKAARYTDARLYPWGNTIPSPGDANLLFSVDNFYAIYIKGNSPKDKSPYGVYDLAGNVSEWTSSIFNSYPGNVSVFTNLGKNVVRGGSFITPFNMENAKAFYRLGKVSDKGYSNVGFRCIWVPSNH